MEAGILSMKETEVPGQNINILNAIQCNVKVLTYSKSHYSLNSFERGI